MHGTVELSGIRVIMNWQHIYNDHAIKSSKDYARLDCYIINNPRKWDENRFNEHNAEL
jgi:hypothetical protein